MLNSWRRINIFKYTLSNYILSEAFATFPIGFSIVEIPLICLLCSKNIEWMFVTASKFQYINWWTMGLPINGWVGGGHWSGKWFFVVLFHKKNMFLLRRYVSLTKWRLLGAKSTPLPNKAIPWGFCSLRCWDQPISSTFC